MNLVLVDYNISDDAACLDGSQVGYYFLRGRGSGINKWMIYHEGGGWCTSLDSCLDRTMTVLGSTTNRDLTFHSSLLTAELSNEPSVNMLMHNWNKVLIIYCDGGSFTGNNNTVTIHKGKKLYFREGVTC